MQAPPETEEGEGSQVPVDGRQLEEEEEEEEEEQEEEEDKAERADDDYCPIEEDEEDFLVDDLDIEAEREEQEEYEEEYDDDDCEFDDEDDDDDEEASVALRRKRHKKKESLDLSAGPFSPSMLAVEIFSVKIKKKMGGPRSAVDASVVAGNNKKKRSPTKKASKKKKKRKTNGHHPWDSTSTSTSGRKKSNKNRLLPDLMNRLITAIPMSSVPQIFARVLKTLPPSDYDIYEIQNLIVTYALDEAKYSGSNVEERIYEDVMRLVTTDKKFLHRHVPVGSSFSHVQTDAAMLKKYEAFLNSPDERSKRRDFLSASGSARHEWTEEELERYEAAIHRSKGNLRAAAKVLGTDLERVRYFAFCYNLLE
jgi:hypothetical protein